MKYTAPVAPDDIWEQLERVRREALEQERPQDSFTVLEYAERFGLPERTAYAQVKKLLAKGRIELAGSFGHQRYYRLKS